MAAVDKKSSADYTGARKLNKGLHFFSKEVRFVWSYVEHSSKNALKMQQ